MKMPDIKLDSLITNGPPTQETLKEIEDGGNVVTSIQPAKLFHPYAAETDQIVFYAKPIDKEEYDKWMKSQESTSQQMAMHI